MERIVSIVRKQNNTIVFSSNACILADGLELKLVFRVADTRTIHAINANVKGYLFRKILSSEGQTIPIKHQIVNFSVEGGCKGNMQIKTSAYFLCKVYGAHR
jgi:hypothetical protein